MNPGIGFMPLFAGCAWSADEPLRCLHAPAAGCLPAPVGLAGWWPGDGNANDIAGTNNGTLQGGATANAVGFVGSAFSFDGTNSYVQIPNAPALRPTNLTIEAWVLFTSLDSGGNGPPAGQQYIVFKQNSLASPFEGYTLFKDRIAGGDVLTFTVSSALGQIAELQSTTRVTAGVWYHVAGVRGSNYLQLYINGQLQGQTSVGFAQDYGNTPLYFGTSGQSYWDRKFKGLLDEVSLYNRALSSDEIAATLCGERGRQMQGGDITLQPQSQTVVIGTNALFTVSATGFGTLGYQWQFNGANVAGATDASLLLTDVQSANAGSYQVVVSNALGRGDKCRRHPDGYSTSHASEHHAAAGERDRFGGQHRELHRYGFRHAATRLPVAVQWGECPRCHRHNSDAG